MSDIKDIADRLIGWFPEYQALSDAHAEMKQKNIPESDNYYHRLGMCRAAQLKNPLWQSDKIAKVFGYIKEADDIRKKVDWESLKKADYISLLKNKGDLSALYRDNPDILTRFIPTLASALVDSQKDLKNNDDGVNLGLQNPEISCRILLKDFDYRSNTWKK